MNNENKFYIFSFVARASAIFDCNMILCQAIIFFLFACAECRSNNDLNFSTPDADFDDENEFFVVLTKFNVGKKPEEKLRESLAFDKLLNITNNAKKKIELYLAFEQLSITNQSVSIAYMLQPEHKAERTKQHSLLDILSYILEKGTDINSIIVNSNSVFTEIEIYDSQSDYTHEKTETLPRRNKSPHISGADLEAEQFLDESLAYVYVDTFGEVAVNPINFVLTDFDENLSEEIPFNFKAEMQEVELAKFEPIVLNADVNVEWDSTEINEPDLPDEVVTLIAEDAFPEEVSVIATGGEDPKSKEYIYLDDVSCFEELYVNMKETNDVKAALTFEEPAKFEIISDNLISKADVIQGYIDPSDKINDEATDLRKNRGQLIKKSTDIADEIFERDTYVEELLKYSEVPVDSHFLVADYAGQSQSKASENVVVTLNEVQGNTETDYDVDNELRTLSRSVKPKPGNESHSTVVT